MTDSVVVVGTNVRNVAQSARMAGFNVLALTKYDDEDLKLYARVEKAPHDKKEAKKRVEEIAESYGAKVILSTGYEDLKVKNELVWGTEPREAARVKDKLKFYRALKRAGIPFPQLVDPNEGEEVICKPRIGGGGEEVFLARKPSKNRDLIYQRYIKGPTSSVSVLAGNVTKAVAVNEILVGWREMNAGDFRYSGNITPFKAPQEVIDTAIETVELFDLRGSVGVDLVIGDKPYVLEINPRFQASLDSIEWSHDLNLFKLHLDSVEGKKIEVMGPKRLAARTVFFADRETRINRSLVGNPFFADIPPRGVYAPESPLVSIRGCGTSRDELLDKIVSSKELFIRYAIQKPEIEQNY